MAEIAYTRMDGPHALQHLDELTDLHQQVYAEPPYNSAAKYGRHQFMQRITSQAASPGFMLVTAREGSALIGYSFGFTMKPAAWWAHAAPPSAQILNSAKFAVIELLVRADHRGRGIGRALYDQLLDGRTEPYATLAAIPEAEAYEMYLRWGWKASGHIRSEPPYAEALVSVLHPD